MAVSLKNFNATMELQAQSTYNHKIKALSGKLDLYVYPVPSLGFKIKHLCEVGLDLAYQIGYSTKFLGPTTIVFGATTSLPDDAAINIDLMNHDRSWHTGFEHAVLRPLFDIKAVSNSIKFAVYTQADMRFGIDINKVGRMDVELNLKIPQLSTAVTAGYSKHFSSPVLESELITKLFVHIEEGGFCSHDDGAAETGARATSAVGVELWFEVHAGEEKAANIYSRKLWNVTNTFSDVCEPLDSKILGVVPEEMAAELLLPLSLVPKLDTLGS